MYIMKSVRECLDGVLDVLDGESLAVDLYRWVIQLQKVPRTGALECAHFGLVR